MARKQRRRGEAQRLAGLTLLAGAALLATAISSEAAGDRILGEYLAAECAACHQLSGQGSTGIPSIIGLPEDRFVAVLDAYARKQRDNQVMQTIAARLSAEDKAALASYFGALTAKP